MNCPNCGTQNDPGNRFCLKCGNALPTAPQVQSTPTSTAPPPLPPGAPTFGWYPPTQGTFPQQSFPQGAYPPPGYYGGGVTTFLNIWGPFAGYGTRKRHVGWLLDGEGHRAPELVGKIEEKFREREIPGSGLFKQSLMARGVVVESRPYFMLRRGLATLALYVCQFGRDLFISQASYIKPPISNFRALVLGAMGLFEVANWCLLFSAFGDVATGDFGALGQNSLGLLCLLSPLYILNNLALTIAVLFGVYKWVKERDFWAILRTPPNEFNEDDLMAMEKAVEETVRQSLTELKLDPENLKMAVATGRGQVF